MEFEVKSFGYVDLYVCTADESAGAWRAGLYLIISGLQQGEAEPSLCVRRGRRSCGSDFVDETDGDPG